MSGRKYYFEVPHNPVGVLFMAHGCVHDASDFWPPSDACKECSGARGGVWGGRAPATSGCGWQERSRLGGGQSIDRRRPSHHTPTCTAPPCAGLPEEVSHTKQALARGYAVIAINSKNRDFDNRCFG